MAFSGWTQGRLAGLLDVGNNILSSWSRGDSEPHDTNKEMIDDMHEKLVVPYLPELEKKADELEKKILQARIRELPKEKNHE